MLDDDDIIAEHNLKRMIGDNNIYYMCYSVFTCILGNRPISNIAE